MRMKKEGFINLVRESQLHLYEMGKPRVYNSYPSRRVSESNNGVDVNIVQAHSTECTVSCTDRRQFSKRSLLVCFAVLRAQLCLLTSYDYITLSYNSMYAPIYIYIYIYIYIHTLYVCVCVCVWTGSRAHPASYTMGTGPFPGVKQPGRGVDQPPHLAPRLKKEYGYTFSPLSLRGLL